MKTSFNQSSIFNLAENVSDFLLEFLNETTHLTREEINDSPQKMDNPKITFFEQRVAALEGGVDALAVKSFNKAKISVIKALLNSGDNIVTYNSHTLYYKDSVRLNRVGIEVKISEDGDLTKFETLIDENTKLIYLETISTEYLTIPDFQKISKIAKERDLPVLVDNTAGAAGYIIKPIKYGANIIIEKTKDWLPSHQGLVGAIIIDGGNYNWQNGKFPQLSNRHISYITVDERYNLVVKKEPVKLSLINHIKKEGNINFSKHAIPNEPLSLIYDINHMNTIEQRKSENAKRLAFFLQRQESVKEVNYPGLPDDKNNELVDKYFKNGSGSELSFSLHDLSDYSLVLANLKSEKSILKNAIIYDKAQIRISVTADDFEDIKNLFDEIFRELKSESLEKVIDHATVREFKELSSLAALF